MPTRRLTLPGTFELGGAIAPNTCAALVMLAAVAPAARQLSALGCLRWLIGRLRAPAPVGIRVITVTTALVVATGVMLMAILNRPVPNHVTIPACVVSAPPRIHDVDLLRRQRAQDGDRSASACDGRGA